MLVSGNCHSRNRAPIPVAAAANTNAQSSPRRAALFKNLVFVTAASLLPLFTGNYSPFSKGKQGKTVSIKMDNRKSDFQNCAAETRRAALTGVWGGTSTSRKVIRSVEVEWMVFRICIYRCIACYYCKGYEKQPIISLFSSRKQCVCVHKPCCDKSRKQCLWRAICEKRSFLLRQI